MKIKAAHILVMLEGEKHPRQIMMKKEELKLLKLFLTSGMFTPDGEHIKVSEQIETIEIGVQENGK